MTQLKAEHGLRTFKQQEKEASVRVNLGLTSKEKLKTTLERRYVAWRS